MILIIDGYNLIFSTLWKKSIQNNKNSANDKSPDTSDSLEEMRNNLISRLKSYNIKRRFNIIIVFDGDESIGYQSHQKQSPYIEIIFSTKKTKADNLIIDLVSDYSNYETPNQSPIHVVTSDRLLAHAVNKSGVQIKSANEFTKELFKISHVKHNAIVNDTTIGTTSEYEPIEKLIGLQPSEVNGWLKVFDSKNE
jgi:predicted RNA-binding protein with PIN domain